MADTTVGWIGIGNMGWPMARNARKAGVDIVVYDVDQGRMGKFAEEFDAKRAPTLKALAAMSDVIRSEEHTSELQSLMRISYAVFCLKKKTRQSMRAHKIHTYKKTQLTR